MQPPQQADRDSRDQAAQRQTQGAQGAGGAQLSVAQRQQLQAEIQQLLKELSAELKHLQARLADQRHEQPNPLAGTGTDPQLYGSPELSQRPSDRQLPIQLGTDEPSSSAARKGGGTGEPSDEVADETPQMTPEETSLSGQPAAEQGVQRQPIPPDYQPVFERLAAPQ